MRYITFSIAALAVLTAANASALQFQATAGAGTASYKYDFEGWPTYNYQFLDIGLNAGIENYYLSLNAMVPVTNAKGDITNQGSSFESEFTRYQYSANIGYRIYPRFSVFAGANLASSELSVASRELSIKSTDYVTITEVGYHIGIAGAPFYFQNVGAVTAKLGFSFGNSFKVDFSDEVGGGSYTDNGNGFVFGIGWNGIITKTWGYYINLDGYSYAYKSKETDENTNSTLGTLKAGIGYNF